MTATLTADNVDADHCPACGVLLRTVISGRAQAVSAPPDAVLIRRAQYEAYEAAAKALANIVPRFEKCCNAMGNATWATEEATRQHREALAALRAAGIQTEGGEK